MRAFPAIVMWSIFFRDGGFSTHDDHIPKIPIESPNSWSKSHQHCVDHHCLQRLPITVLQWPVLKPRQYPRYSRRSLSSVFLRSWLSHREKMPDTCPPGVSPHPSAKPKAHDEETTTKRGQSQAQFKTWESAKLGSKNVPAILEGSFGRSFYLF